MLREPKLMDYLSARPSFLTGIARLFDFWGLFRSSNVGRNAKIADSKALYSDWHAIGQDLQKAVRSYARELR